MWLIFHSVSSTKSLYTGKSGSSGTRVLNSMWSPLKWRRLLPYIPQSFWRRLPPRGVGILVSHVYRWFAFLLDRPQTWHSLVRPLQPWSWTVVQSWKGWLPPAWHLLQMKIRICNFECKKQSYHYVVPLLRYHSLQLHSILLSFSLADISHRQKLIHLSVKAFREEYLLLTIEFGFVIGILDVFEIWTQWVWAFLKGISLVYEIQVIVGGSSAGEGFANILKVLDLVTWKKAKMVLPQNALRDAANFS